MTLMHQPPETPLSRRIQRNSSGNAGLGAGGVGMPGLFSPHKRVSTTSASTDEYSGTTQTMTNDESEASDMNDFDAFGLSSSPVKKPSSNEPFSPFEFSTANFDTDANFFATTTNKLHHQQPGFGTGDGFDAFPVLSQVVEATSVSPPLDEDATLNDDDDEDLFSPKPLSRKPSSSSSRGVLSESRSHSTHGTAFTASGRNPPSHSNSASSSTNNRGGGRRASRSHHARPTDDEGLGYNNKSSSSGNQEQQTSEGDLKTKSQSRKGSSRRISTSSAEKPTDDEPPTPKTSRRSSGSNNKSSQRSHSLGRRSNTSAKLSSTKHRKSNNEDIASPRSKSNEAEKDKEEEQHQQEKVSRRAGRPNLTRESSFTDRKANPRKSILKTDHNPSEEALDSKSRSHRGRGSELESSKRRSNSESRRTALSTKMSGGHNRRPSTNNPSDLDQPMTTNNNIHQGRSFRRSAASIEMSMAKKDEMDVLLSSPVSKGGSNRQERTVGRSVGRFHSDLGKGAHHEGRRPSRRLLALEATRAGGDEGDEMLSPGSKDSGSHSGRRAERFNAPQRSSSFVEAGLALPPEDTATLECTPFTLSRGSSFKQPRGSARACRRSLLKEDVFASPRPTDTKGGVSNRRLGGSIHSSNLASSTHTSNMAAGIGGLLGSPILSKKSPGTGNVSGKRPVLERSPPAQSHSDSSAMRKRDFDPRLNNLLQKLRDPSLRDLNPEKESGFDDDDVTAEGIPVNQRGVFTRIAPMRHKSFTDA